MKLVICCLLQCKMRQSVRFVNFPNSSPPPGPLLVYRMITQVRQSAVTSKISSPLAIPKLDNEFLL